MASNRPENATSQDRWKSLPEELGLLPEPNSTPAPRGAEDSLELGVATPAQSPDSPKAARRPDKGTAGDRCFGEVTGGKEDGCCFIRHEKAPLGVFLPPQNTKSQLEKGDLVEFKVDDWERKPRPTAQWAKKIVLDYHKLLYGTVVEWDHRNCRGTILPQRASYADLVSFSDIDAHPKITAGARQRGKSVRFIEGQIVSFSPTNVEHPIFVHPARSLRPVLSATSL